MTQLSLCRGTHPPKMKSKPGWGLCPQTLLSSQLTLTDLPGFFAALIISHLCCQGSPDTTGLELVLELVSR